MPVGVPGKQHEIMREAVENQSPDVIIVDEISTQQEVQAARTIAQRGVMLIATVHGITLPELIHCKERGVLMGGVTSVTLSGREADRRFDRRKQVQKRAQEPVFSAALELHSRNKWVYHSSIKEAADAYFEADPCDAEEFRPGRSVSIAGTYTTGAANVCHTDAFKSIANQRILSRSLTFEQRSPEKERSNTAMNVAWGLHAKNILVATMIIVMMTLWMLETPSREAKTHDDHLAFKRQITISSSDLDSVV